ncbi:integrin alpha-M-like [Callorhinchus milii]|uniref:integrin alpha-M-like n=1 Tax=Callorhinchus milii TaxID=7868 RepID=UPI001C3F7D42|nr:integrin alpha-M-like [Callorhinchus milii]
MAERTATGVEQRGRGANRSPVLKGSSIDGKLRYFGRSIDGSLDLTGDNLTDISVGALDHLFILRSRPVLQLKVTVTFTPDNISPLDDGCSAPAAQGTPVTANVCFTIIKDIPDTLGNLNVKISYQLALDIARKIQRAELGSQRSGTQSVDTGRKEACVKTQINVKPCILDSLNPILLHVAASVTGEKISGQRNLIPVMKGGENITHTGTLLFKKQCGSDDICTDQLEVMFDFQG